MVKFMLERGEKRWMTLVWTAALAIQLIYLAEGFKDPSFLEPIIDASSYDQLARDITAGQFLPDGAFWQPPFYQYFLAGIYFLAGPHILAAKLAQALIGATSCLLTYLIGRRFFSRATGIIAGLITAVYGPMIFFNGRLLSTGLEVFLYLFALWLLLIASESPRPSRWLACGLVTGLAAITRPSILVLLAEGLAVIIVLSLKQRSYRAWAASAACLVLGTSLTIAPATLGNYLVERRLVLISTNGGINLFIGNNPRSEETIAIRPGVDWKNLLDIGWFTGAPTRIELDQYFFQRAKEFILDHPREAFINLLRKARLFWNSYETPRNVDIYLFRNFSGLLSLLVWRCGSFSFPFGILAPLAALGMIVGCRGGRGRVLLLVFVGLYSVSVILFFIAARYRLPVVPVLSLFAGAGIVWLRRQFLARRYRSIIAAAIFCLATGLWVNLPVRAPTHDVNFHAELYNLLGMRNLHTHKNPEAAEKEFRRSLAIDPSYAVVHGRLGSVLAEEGKIDEAAAECRRAFELDPGLYEPRYTLANLLVSQGHDDEALEQFRRTIELKQDHAEAHNNLAGILARRGRTEEALKHFRKSLALKPNAPEGVYLNMVILLKREGRFAEVVRTMRAGIQNHPGSAGMKANLAWVLATCPEDSIRDGDKAVRLAESAGALSGYSNPDLLDTLAAAYAEAGRFDDAIKRAQDAGQLCSSTGRTKTAKQIKKRIKLYKSGKPYRERSEQ